MFKKLLRNKKAQQTAEYALLISLVVAAVIAMQTYAQRAMQARIRGAAQYLGEQTSQLGTANQYEPYYLDSSYDIFRDDENTKIHNQDTIKIQSNSVRTRYKDGAQRSLYDTGLGLVNGL
jgi:uncharacterized protein (UPF0333 family)